MQFVSFSGARVSMTFQRPLNSSISEMSLRISGVMVMFLMSSIGDIHFHPFLPNSLPNGRKYPFIPIFTLSRPCPGGWEGSRNSTATMRECAEELSQLKSSFAASACEIDFQSISCRVETSRWA
jgi:hypothetical protein